jgi:hypothetical protein
MVVLAVFVGALFPVLLLRHRGDAMVTRWLQAGGGAEGPWDSFAFLGSPLVWLAASVVGFGVAGGMDWPNTARWMGMLAFGVLWAGLADIAVEGATAGSATAGMVAATLSLWGPRAAPIWGAVATGVLLAQVLSGHALASAAIVEALLGALGPLAIEFCWHTVSPGSAPVRGSDWRS